MGKRVLYIIIISLFFFKQTLAQEDNLSKWSVTGSITPHFTNDFLITFPVAGLGISYQPSTFDPAIYINASYKPFKHFSLQAGLGYNLYYTPIQPINPYLQEYELDYSSHSGAITERAAIDLLELPGTVNYYILDKKNYGLYLSIEDISSFMVGKTYLLWSKPIERVPTTIYQNYLQFALGFELKTGPQWSFYASPLYRMALVNYHDAVHYNIYAYPNVFYERMLGLEIGAKYNFLKRKGTPVCKPDECNSLNSATNYE